MTDTRCDVVVVGGGNAALCAALSAREQGAEVIVLETASEALRGGNSRFTGGSVRMVINGMEDLEKIYSDELSAEERTADFGTYTAEQFFDEMGRLTQYRTHPDLCEVMITRSFESYLWSKSKGVKFIPAFGRKAYKVDGRFKFYGGIPVYINGGGEGLIDALYKAADREGIRVLYGTRAISLIQQDGAVVGVEVRSQGKAGRVTAKAVVLACGGFEANHEMRTRYLGQGWEMAKVRGTRFNQGDGLRMALEAGASPFGQWSGCHAISWDLNAPEFGDLALGDAFSRHSYALGVMINSEGKRFVDEGADIQSFTYAKYGAAVLAQPGQVAWQVWDQKMVPLKRDVYRGRRVSRELGNTFEELAGKLEGIDREQFVKTMVEYNAAIQTDRPFNPAILDGRSTTGLPLPKSNWAVPIDEPPFEAHPVTCGITFTFGGLRINTAAQALDIEEKPIAGLFVAGELVGGLFYFNYPSGTGLTSGTVFGRIAGEGAGRLAKG